MKEDKLVEKLDVSRLELEDLVSDVTDLLSVDKLKENVKNNPVGWVLSSLAVGLVLANVVKSGNDSNKNSDSNIDDTKQNLDSKNIDPKINDDQYDESVDVSKDDQVDLESLNKKSNKIAGLVIKGFKYFAPIIIKHFWDNNGKKIEKDK